MGWASRPLGSKSLLCPSHAKQRGQVTFGSSPVKWEFSTSTSQYRDGAVRVAEGKGLEQSLASEQEVFWSHAHPYLPWQSHHHGKPAWQEHCTRDMGPNSAFPSY